MATVRKPFQGVLNVFKFNWHFYVIAFCVIFICAFLTPLLPSSVKFIAILILGLAILMIIVSSLVTYYIYDISNLYNLDWLKEYDPTIKVVNITAGFDETSELIVDFIPESQLTVLDFYDEKKHTEISIKRARTAYPPFKDTLQIETSKIPLDSDSVDLVIAFLSAHEIRNNEERIQFFKESNRTLKPEGEIIVVEHIRDIANFIAYNFGYFHFHSNSTWLHTFKNADLEVKKAERITPFITKFTLKDGHTH